MIETKVITYQSEPAMKAGIQQMEAKGWEVTNVQESKQHGANSCLIIILALTIVGLLLLPFLLFSANKTYTVTFQRKSVSGNEKKKQSVRKASKRRTHLQG